MWPSSLRPASSLFGFGIAVIVVATLIAKEVEARLPPKLLKVASGTRKALYARGYGYSVIPIPQKILLQANFARREVHGKRPPVRTKRPPRRNKRPPPEYASRYKDYRPGRKRRPMLYADPPEYNEQELDEELDYEDRPNKEYEDFVSKHAELYADGYSTRKKPKRYRDEVTAFSENSEPVYVRKPPPRWKSSTKLYSAAIGARPPIRQKEKFEYEDDDDGDNNNYFKQKGRRKNRYKDKYRGERYGEQEEDDEEEESNPQRYQVSKRNPLRDWDPDNVYHDRYYDLKQEKNRRAVQPPRRYTNQYSPFRNRWTTGSGNDDDKQRWYTNIDEMPKSNPPQDRYKWASPEVPEQYQWSDPRQHNRWSMENQNSQGSQRWKESVPISDVRWSNVKENVEVKDSDIITSQNADKWVKERSTESPKEVEDWVKEHSVGYGIELDGGQKKRMGGDPDVVYGQAGNSKPRIPDIGYGQGLEVAGGNSWGHNYQSS